jgi:hypothetical protein
MVVCEIDVFEEKVTTVNFEEVDGGPTQSLRYTDQEPLGDFLAGCYAKGKRERQ